MPKPSPRISRAWSPSLVTTASFSATKSGASARKPLTSTSRRRGQSPWWPHTFSVTTSMRACYPAVARHPVYAMLIYSMGVSVDGFITDRDGNFAWGAPSDEQFRFHIEQVRELGAYLCGRRLYETMLVWETDPSMRDSELRAAFADVWCAIPKVVFSRTLDSVQGNARLAEASVAEEAAAALDATDKDVSIGGACLAAAAIELGLVDELRMFRNPVVVGGGTPFLPPVTEDVPLDLIEI